MESGCCVTPLEGHAGRGLCQPRKASECCLAGDVHPEPFTNENG